MSREEHLMEYLVSKQLNVLTNGNMSNFEIINRKGVTDLTLETDKTGDLVSN
jgi:hypothetical protein